VGKEREKRAGNKKEEAVELTEKDLDMVAGGTGKAYAKTKRKTKAKAKRKVK
jgi:hypothetical protein